MSKRPINLEWWCSQNNPQSLVMDSTVYHKPQLIHSKLFASLETSTFSSFLALMNVSWRIVKYSMLNEVFGKKSRRFKTQEPNLLQCLSQKPAYLSSVASKPMGKEQLTLKSTTWRTITLRLCLLKCQRLARVSQLAFERMRHVFTFAEAIQVVAQMAQFCANLTVSTWKKANGVDSMICLWKEMNFLLPLALMGISMLLVDSAAVSLNPINLKLTTLPVPKCLKVPSNPNQNLQTPQRILIQPVWHSQHSQHSSPPPLTSSANAWKKPNDLTL